MTKSFWFIAFVLICTLLVTTEVQAKDTGLTIVDNERNFERVSIKWVNPKKYTDIRPSNQSRVKFRKHVFTQFENHFSELAMKLPEDQFLSVRVTDIDLAGRVEPGTFIGLSSGINDIRVLRNIDIPRIKFDYQLLDKSGNTLKEETVNLKDMSYLFNSNRAFTNRRAFGYEKRMLSEWFKTNLAPS